MNEDSSLQLGAIIIGFIVLLAWLVISATSNGVDQCKKYGSDWEYRAGYFSHCVNSNGNVKGI